jgi:predicted DNA binding CopG/RHH family protein
MKKIPKFKTDEEAARFWEAHRFEDYHRDTKEAEIRFIKKTKKAITIRLDPDDIKSVEVVAQRKGLNYTSLLRMWIKENLSKETGHMAH